MLVEALEDTAHKMMATKAANSSKKDGKTAAEQISGHVMPSDRIVIDSKRSSDPDPEVHHYLASNNYKITDYKRGLAAHVNTPEREVRIGKIMGLLNAPQAIRNKYESDPAKHEGNISASKIVISRHPYDVAAMSTNQKWPSCTSLGGGVCAKDEHGNEVVQKQERGKFADTVPGIIASGAHIAYLVNHPDDVKEHYKPLARTTLNVFQSKSGHKILRPSEVYSNGIPLSGFHAAVKEWAEKNFPAKDMIYTRHANSYPEGDSEVFNFAPEHDDQWKKIYHSEALSQHPSKDVIEHHVSEAIRTKRFDRIDPFLKNQNTTDEQIGRMLNAFKKEGTISVTLSRAIRTPEHAQILLDGTLGNYRVAKELASHPKTTAEQLHFITDTYGVGQDSDGGRSLVHAGYSPDVVERVASNPNANDSHFKKILSADETNSHDFDDYFDMHPALEHIAKRYNDKEIGRALVAIHQRHNGGALNLIGHVASKHPDLLDSVSKESIEYEAKHPTHSTKALRKIYDSK